MAVSTDPLAGLNPQQREAVENTEGAVLVLAGAGSGKTRVLAHRIAHIVHQGLAKPWQVLAVTFTNKAARELRERVAAITPGGEQVGAGTFHAMMAKLLRRETDAIGYPKDFTIFDSTDSVRLVKLILDDFNDERFRPKVIYSVISRLRNDLISPEEYAKTVKLPLEELVAKVYPRYEARKKVLAGMDFDDLLLKPIELFRSHPAILNAWSSRWQYLHVDEYQDTNLAQFELIRLLAGPRPNLCVVGDDDQSIYGWRGARVENIFRFKDAFEGARIFRLEQNYRSSQAILDLAHSVVSRSSKREEKKLWTEKQGGELPHAVVLPNDMEEAREIADQIGRAVLSGKRMFRDHAILYRTNAQSRLFEEMLRGRRYPYQIVGSVGFYDRKEIRDAIAYFKLCLNPRDDLSLRRIISEPPRGIGATTLDRLVGWASERDKSLTQAMREGLEIEGLGKRAVTIAARFADQIDSWRSRLETMEPHLWAKMVLEESEYLPKLREAKGFEEQGRIENIEAFITSIAEFSGSMSEYLEEAAIATDQDKYEPGSDTVKLMTIHAAKGLEFPVVYVTGLEAGMFPLQNDDSDSDLDEERRLFYVAVTRAREELILTAAQSRRVWGQLQLRALSIFLKELDEETVEWDSGRPALGVPNARTRFGSDGGALPIWNKPASSATPLHATPARNPRGHTVRTTAAERGTRHSSGGSVKEDIPAVRPGDLIEHPKFGKGIVVSTTKFRNDIKVSVEFDSVGKLNLLQSVARLQPVKDFSS